MRIATIVEYLGIGLDAFRDVAASKDDQAFPSFLDEEYPHNIGDWYVTKVTDRILKIEDLYVLHLSATDRDWDIVNSECDALVLKGGNYIQEDWLSKNFGLELFKKIKIPIIMFGVGLQATLGEKVEFTRDEIEILKIIHGSCACSSVRGATTAEALNNIGIDNVVVTGCPVLFWSLQPTVQVGRPTDRNAGFTFRQGLYTDDLNVHRAQFQAIETLRDKFATVKVILQGEEVLLQNYHEARFWGARSKDRLEEVADSGICKLKRVWLDLEELRRGIHGTYDRIARPGLVDWVMNNTFFSYDVGEYIREFQSKSMMLGCRLHSNLLSLAHGIPTFYMTYDQRTQEVVNLFRIPHCKLVNYGPEVELFNNDWKPFEERYAHYYQETRRFLDANHLNHRMACADEPTAAAQTGPAAEVEAQPVIALYAAEATPEAPPAEERDAPAPPTEEASPPETPQPAERPRGDQAS